MMGNSQNWMDFSLFPIQSHLLRFATMIILAYPQGFIFKRLKSTREKHLFSLASFIILGFLFVSVAVTLHLLLFCLLVYFVSFMFKNSRWMPICVFVSSLGLLTLYNLGHQVFEPERPDLSAPIMVMVMKLSGYAWSVYDGSRVQKTLSKRQEEYAIRHLPSLIEYFGFCTFFAGWITGPSVEFNDYMSFIECKHPFNKVPDCTKATMATLLLAMVCFIFYMTFEKRFHYIHTTHDSFLQYSWMERVLFFFIAGFTVRCKYYAVWKASEAGHNLIGINYSGNNQGKEQWDRIRNIDPFQIELAQNARQLLAGWNIRTHYWLKNFVYIRVIETVDENEMATPTRLWIATLATYFSSALWHGLRACFYLTFLSGALVTICNQILRRHLRPFFQKGPLLESVYNIFSWLTTMFIFNYICSPITIHTLDNGLKSWKSVGYVGHWGIGLVLFSSLFLKSPSKRKKE